MSHVIVACRSCAKPIFFAESASSGKKIPLDVEPADTGTFWLTERDGDIPKATYTKQRFLQRYTSHFATCPNAKKHRKRARRPLVVSQQKGLFR